jgi:NADP-dependent 3-hydroxy acid dehydrogenase YdfG
MKAHEEHAMKTTVSPLGFHPAKAALACSQFARQFLEKGNRVIATARDVSKAQKLSELKERHSSLDITELDVTSLASIEVWAQS